jgi:hypothetical protein
VRRVFRSSGVTLFADSKILLAIPEHAVPVGGAGGDSKTDVWVLARCGGTLISVAVEGKVNEPFGDLVRDWLRKREDEAERRERPTGAPARLALLEQRLALGPAASSKLRYQLLHRTASALIEAERFNAGAALMLVHSFGPRRTGFKDFCDFVDAMGGVPPSHDAVTPVGSRGGVELFLGWATGDDEYLIA